MLYAAFGDIVRGHNVRILTFSQASCCEYLLASVTLVLQVPSPTPNSNHELSYFTATVTLFRGCSGA